METNAIASPKLKIKTKWPKVVLPFSNHNDIEQPKENAKNQNTWRATPTWLKVWQNGPPYKN